MGCPFVLFRCCLLRALKNEIILRSEPNRAADLMNADAHH